MHAPDTARQLFNMRRPPNGQPLHKGPFRKESTSPSPKGSISGTPQADAVEAAKQ